MFRIPQLLFCICLCMSFAASGVQAAPHPSVFLDVQLADPEDGFASLELRFVADEQACRKAYGKNWQRECQPNLGESGQLAAGVQLSPPHPGEWRWDDDSLLRFTPEKAWTPNSVFQIQLPGSVLPANSSLRSPKPAMRTPPEAANIESYTIFVDPSPAAKHVLMHTVRFLYPTDANRTQGIRVTSADPASGLRLSAPEFVWNHSATELTINTRVLELSEKSTRVRVSVPGLPLFLRENGQNTLYPKKPVEGVYLVGGKEGLLKISDLEIAVVHNERLQREYRLNMTSNLLLDPVQTSGKIQAIQLPRTRSPEAQDAFAWHQAPVIDAEDLAKGRRIALENTGEHTGVIGKLSFRLPVEAGSYIYLLLPADLTSASGLKLGQARSAVLRIPAMAPELHFLQPGNVLPLAGEQKLGLHASGLDRIRWEVTQALPGMLVRLLDDASAFDYSWSSRYTAGPVARGELELAKKGPGAPQFSVLDLAPFLKTPQGEPARGLLLVHLEGLVGDKAVTNAVRCVLATDLGLVIKKAADGSRDVFVASLSKGQPVAGAVVDVLGRNGLPVASTRSDDAGRARLPSLKGLEREKEPLVVTARLENDFAYLPLNDANRNVNYSAFATAGQRGGDGMNAYVFSQRGIFRPGEDLRFACIVRTADWSAWPQNLPLSFALWAPGGKKLVERAFTPGPEGLAEFSWSAPESAAAGRYRLDVLLGTGDSALVLGSAAARVEEFQPDTLQLNLNFSARADKGWASPKGLSAELLLRNLYGLPAADRRMRAEYEITPALLRFPGYEDYAFYDAAPYSGETQTHSLPESRSDAEGKARFQLPLDQIAGGTFRLNLLAEGFEPGGGRAVSTRSGILLSSMDYAVGYRAKQQLGYIPQDRELALDFVALAPDLNPHNPGPLAFVVSQRHFVSSLVRDKAGRYRYDSTPVDKEISRRELTFGPEKTPLRFTLPTNAPGDFVLSVFNAQGGQVATVPFTVAGNALRVKDGLAPGKLMMRPNKQDYASGDVVELFITTPFDGTGLLTLEREGVVAHTWFQAKRGDSVQRLAIPADFEGRGYVNLSFARSMHSDEIYMEPHLVALAPVSIGVTQRDLGISVKAPELVKPGEDIQVELRAREAGKVLLFAVDEGVLQLTRFRTPSPLDYLLRDRALEVETLHALDLIMPDYARLQNRISAFGGDLANPVGRFHNPFRRKSEPPLQFWSGITEVGPQARTISFKVPSYYNGQVRIMAVGANTGKVSAIHCSTTVRAPLIITPQLPVLAAPGDSFAAAVALANTTEAPLEVTLALDAGQALQLEGTAPARATIPPGAESVLPLHFKVLHQPGEARVRFTAGREGETPTVREASLSVRPPTPLISSLQGGYAAESLRIDVPRTLYPHLAASTASVSALPLPAIQGLARWLAVYPYGCTEQLISRAFPWAVLLSRPELLGGSAKKPDQVRNEAEKLVSAAVADINERLHEQRGLAAWPGADPDPLLTAYAFDFLLAVREAGLPAPNWLENKLLGCLERILSSRPNRVHEARAQAYAVWLLTRSGRIVTQQLEILTEFVNAHPEALQDVTASLMAGTCRMLKLEDKAGTLIKGFKAAPLPDSDLYPWDRLATQALHMTVLARNFPELLNSADKDAPTEKLVQAALADLRRGRFATFSAALSVRALAALSKASEADIGKVRITCVQGGADEALDLGSAVKGVSAPNCTRYALEVPKGAGWHWQIFTEGFDRVPPATALAEGLEIQRSYVDANGNPLTDVPLGTLVTVRIDARSHGQNVENAVLLDLLPGGFEMVLPTSDKEATESRAAANPADPPPLKADWTDRREDRMIVFNTLTPKVQRFTYQIRAVNKGNYTLPPVSAEAMYNTTLRARSAAGKIEVK